MKSLNKNLNVKDLEDKLTKHLSVIVPMGETHKKAGQHHIDNLTKPVGSLGQLEDMALSLYCISEGKKPLNIDPALMLTIAADHGVVEEGVSSAKQEVTRQMVLNFLNGGAGVNALCNNSNMDFIAVNAGVKGPLFDEHKLLINAKVADGSANIAKGPAMTHEETLRSLLVGIELAEQAVEKGYRCLATGEMGIGNTTPSSALYCAWLGLSAEDATGPGAGLPGSQLAHKASVIAKALEANSEAIKSRDPLKILAAVGGIEIAVMAGIMLGAAKCKTPMLIDGFIASAAFLTAWKLVPALQDYCFFAHCSAETAHQKVLTMLGKKPMLDLGFRLGEGTGAALGLSILRASVAVFNQMASFDSAGVTSNN